MTWADAKTLENLSTKLEGCFLRTLAVGAFCSEGPVPARCVTWACPL